MEKFSIWFLKAVFVLFCIPVLALAIFLVPQIGDEVAFLLSDWSFIKWIVMFVFWVSIVPFLFGVWRILQLLHMVEKGTVKSEKAYDVMGQIKLCGYSIAMLHILMLPVFYLYAEYDDAPGVILVGCFIPLLAFSLSMFMFVLQKVLRTEL